jgi:hypothetical protein
LRSAAFADSEPKGETVMRKIIGIAIASLALVAGSAPAANAYRTPSLHHRLCGVTRTVHEWSYSLPQPDGSTMVITQYVKKRTKCRTGTTITMSGSSTTYLPAPATS